MYLLGFDVFEHFDYETLLFVQENHILAPANIDLFCVSVWKQP